MKRISLNARAGVVSLFLVLTIAISPVLLGAGERLFEGINLPALGYACTRHESSPLATHVVLTRQ